MTKINNRKPSHENWDPCHPGIIHAAAKDGDVSRRRMFQIVGAGVAVGIVGSGTVVGMLLSDEKAPKNRRGMPAGIGCITVLDQLPAFIAGKISDEGLNKRIGSHLINCKSCCATYDALRHNSCCPSRPKKATLKPDCTGKLPRP